MANTVPPLTGQGIGASPAPSPEGAGGISFWRTDPSWEAHRDLASPMTFLFIVTAIAVVTIAALIAGGSGSPQFSIGLAFGVGVGAVPYLLFVVAHAGSDYALGDRPHRRHKLTEEEWQRIFGQRYGSGATAGGPFFGSASSTNGRTESYGHDAAADAREQILRAYALLGLSADASQRDVRRAYHRLAHRYHPDKAAGQSDEVRRLADQRMKELNVAYGLLRRQSEPGGMPPASREPTP